MTASDDANEPGAGTDGRDEDWSRQRVERDAGLIDFLTAKHGKTAAEAPAERDAAT